MFHEHKKEIEGMKLIINAVADTPPCMSIHSIQDAIHKDLSLQKIKEHIIKGLLFNQNVTCQEMIPYWTISDDLTMIHMVAMKGKRVIILEE